MSIHHISTLPSMTDSLVMIGMFWLFVIVVFGAVIITVCIFNSDFRKLFFDDFRKESKLDEDVIIDVQHRKH